MIPSNKKRIHGLERHWPSAKLFDGCFDSKTSQSHLTLQHLLRWCFWSLGHANTSNKLTQQGWGQWNRNVIHYFSVVEDILWWHHQKGIPPKIMKNNMMRSTKHISGMFLDLDGLWTVFAWSHGTLLRKMEWYADFMIASTIPVLTHPGRDLREKKWHTLSGHSGENPSWKKIRHGWFLVDLHLSFRD